MSAAEIMLTIVMSGRKSSIMDNLIVIRTGHSRAMCSIVSSSCSASLRKRKPVVVVAVVIIYFFGCMQYLAYARVWELWL